MLKYILQFLGLRCKCGGKMKEVKGWNFDECDRCGKKKYYQNYF